MQVIKAIKPLDGHSHMRVGETMKAAVPLVASACQAAIIEPNTANIRTGAQAGCHRQEIKDIAERAGYPDFQPYMTVMLTNDTDPADVATWRENRVAAGKGYPGDLYPHGGVNDISKIDDVLREMGRAGIPVEWHFERAGVHPLEAELAAIPDFLRLADRGDVRIVFAHVSTAKGLEAVRQYPHAAAGITPMGLWMTSEDVFYPDGRIRNVHNWCRPVAKTPEDREALIEAAISGDPKFFYGSDFAPHLAFAKGAVPPPAGCACYPAAIPVVAEVFASRVPTSQLIPRITGFTSRFAGEFYGDIKISTTSTLTIVENSWVVDGFIPVGSQGEGFVPWLAGVTLPWQVVAA